MVSGGIRIIYSRIGEKADSVIERIISSERGGWIVVTSDRDIASHAWATGSVPISGEDFMNSFERVLPDSDDTADYDEKYPEQRRKGNPRKLSKKQKAVRRVLSKL